MNNKERKNRTRTQREGWKKIEKDEFHEKGRGEEEELNKKKGGPGGRGALAYSPPRPLFLSAFF